MRTPEQIAATEAAERDAYQVLNRAEHHPLNTRLAAVATALRHGGAGMGNSAVLDRMAQGVAFLCEHASRREETLALYNLMKDFADRQHRNHDAADQELMKSVIRMLAKVG